MRKIAFIFVLVLITLSGQARASSPLAPLKTETPRQTMATFIEAMNDYKQGVRTGINSQLARIDDAVRCMNLDDISIMSRQTVGREAAVMLKEVIDRVIVLDYNKIPGEKELKDGEIKDKWRLKDTEIKIVLIAAGERKGEWLFSQDTIQRAREFYEKVKNLPYIEGGGNGAGYKEPWLQSHLPAWAADKCCGLGYWQWVGLLLALILGLVIRPAVRSLVRTGRHLTSRTKTKWDDHIITAVASPAGLGGAIGFWFLAIYILRISGVAFSVLSVVLQILLFGSLTWLFYRLTGVLSLYLKEITAKTEDILDDQLVRLATRTLEVLIIVLGALLTAQNLGIDVVSLLAGLGIGGLAVALAAKDSLANFFGSIMIMLDRPFKVGHWIRVSGVEGTVEDIGFRSTKIRTFYNSLISVPNSEIAVANVDNMGLREYRRIYTTLGVTYDTPPEKIEAFLEGIKNIIKANPFTRKDYFHVVLSNFGASSLDIMLYFFVRTPDWSEELVQRQNVFLEIIRLAQELGVDFAFPTQSVHIETFPEKEPVRKPHSLETELMTVTASDFGREGKLAKPGGSGLFVPPHTEKKLK